VKATEVTVDLAESNASLLPGWIWRYSLHVTCGLTACTPASAPRPTLGDEYGKTLPFYLSLSDDALRMWQRRRRLLPGEIWEDTDGLANRSRFSRSRASKKLPGCYNPYERRVRQIFDRNYYVAFLSVTPTKRSNNQFIVIWYM